MLVYDSNQATQVRGLGRYLKVMNGILNGVTSLCRNKYARIVSLSDWRARLSKAKWDFIKRESPLILSN